MPTRSSTMFFVDDPYDEPHDDPHDCPYLDIYDEPLATTASPG